MGGIFLTGVQYKTLIGFSKREGEFETDFSEPRERLQPKIIGQLERLSDLLNNPGVPPIKHPYPFTAFTQYFREDISELIGESYINDVATICFWTDLVTGITFITDSQWTIYIATAAL